MGFSMPKLDFTAHARDMLNERSISEDWVWRAIDNPDKKRMATMIIFITQKQ
jgi:hypothetical protein